MTPADLAARLAELSSTYDRPLVVALDGRSSAGKSTLAAWLAEQLSAHVIEGDDFYSGGHGIEWDQMTPQERYVYCIDWRRLRPVIRLLREGQTAAWHPFDWSSTDGRRLSDATTLDPADIVIVEGVYSARPETADLVDIRVLLDTPADVRAHRFANRPRQTSWTSVDADRQRWADRFSAAEGYYLRWVMPARAFDLVVGDPRAQDVHQVRFTGRRQGDA